MRIFLEQRFGELKLQGPSFVPVGAELAQGHAFSLTLTQSDFAKSSQPIPTTPRLWAARQKLLPRSTTIYVTASLVNCVGWQRFPDRISVHAWLASPLELLCCKAPMCTVSTTSLKLRKPGKWRRLSYLWPHLYRGRLATTLKGRSCASEKGKSIVAP